MKRVVHSKLGGLDIGLVRTGGCGLANCMFFATRGLIFANDNGLRFLRPTWERFGIGPIIRREKDKRFYFGLFKGWLSLDNFYKCFRLLFRRNVVCLSGWWNYGTDMITNWDLVRNYFFSNINEAAICKVPYRFKNTIALHIRRGDMPDVDTISTEWSYRMLKLVLAEAPNANVLLFSDGNDDELKEFLDMPNVTRAFYGNAIADIVAISRCQVVIGTYSTFSWWGAYLSQAPYVAYIKRNAGCCHKDSTKYCEMGDSGDFPVAFRNHIRIALNA